MAVHKRAKSRKHKDSSDSVEQWMGDLLDSLHRCRPPLPVIIIKAHYLKSGIDFDTICDKKQMKDVLEDLAGCGEDVNIVIAVLSEQASVDRLRKEAEKRLQALRTEFGKETRQQIRTLAKDLEK